MRRVPRATELSLRILKGKHSAVELTCVPPHNSSEVGATEGWSSGAVPRGSEGAAIDTILTMSPYLVGVSVTVERASTTIYGDGCEGQNYVYADRGTR